MSILLENNIDNMKKEDFKYKYCYKITLTKGSLKDKIYFGQHITNDLNDGYKGRGRKLIDYYKKYPEDYIKEIISFHNTIEELDKAEYDLIHPHLGKDYCLNLIEGGHVNRMCDELKQKLSNSKKGKTTWIKGKCHTEETKQKISNILKEKYTNNEIKINCWNKGKTLTEETKQKMSESRKKYYLTHEVSKDTREKLSKIWKGKHHSEETKQKISDTLKGFKMSDETKQKISNSMKGKKCGPKGKHKVWDNKELNIYHFE